MTTETRLPTRQLIQPDLPAFDVGSLAPDLREAVAGLLHGLLRRVLVILGHGNDVLSGGLAADRERANCLGLSPVDDQLLRL